MLMATEMGQEAADVAPAKTPMRPRPKTATICRLVTSSVTCSVNRRANLCGLIAGLDGRSLASLAFDLIAATDWQTRVYAAASYDEASER